MSRSSLGHTERIQAFLVRSVPVIVACTVALTFSFFGIVALATSATSGIAERLPFYAFGMAAIFVATIVFLDQKGFDGRAIIVAAFGSGVLSLVLLSLGGEGVVYVIENRQTVAQSNQFMYLVAAGLMTTGVSYWVLRHWQDLVDSSGM